MSGPDKEWLTQEELVAELKKRGVDMTEGRSDRNVRRTLYYYRYRGLITPPTRRMVGKRLTLFYHRIVISEVETIKTLQKKGKKLEDIEAYMKKLVRSGFVSDVQDMIFEVEKRYNIKPRPEFVTLTSMSGDGQFIHIKTRPENIKAVRELMDKIGFEAETITDKEIDRMAE